jgi:transcriptional regulator with XRE-family HTH domain
VRLGEKLSHLRQVEGIVRGLSRPLSKAEVVRAMRSELGRALSHAYLSQIESGARVHLSAGSRDLLARFFKVHPGYLVDDPPDFHTEIASSPLFVCDDLRTWLASRASEWVADPLVRRVLRRLSEADDPRRYIALLDELLDVPIDSPEKEVELEKDLHELKRRLRDRAPQPQAGVAPVA